MSLRLGRVLAVVTVLILAIAACLLYWSWRVRTNAWGSGVLTALGVIFLPFVPLAVLGHLIEDRIESVRTQQERISSRQEQTASDVARLTEEVAQTQADLRLTREQLSEEVRERITVSKARDSLETGRVLYEAGALAVKPPRSDDPPF